MHVYIPRLSIRKQKGGLSSSSISSTSLTISKSSFNVLYFFKKDFKSFLNSDNSSKIIAFHFFYIIPYGIRNFSVKSQFIIYLFALFCCPPRHVIMRILTDGCSRPITHLFNDPVNGLFFTCQQFSKVSFL
jgi:hypothetical protein